MEILGGPLFAVAGAGESHGPGYVTIVMGCPPGLWLTRGDIQKYLDRRRPGSSIHGTTRREQDQVLLLSGIYNEGIEQSALLLLDGPEIRISNQGDGTVTRTYAEGFTTGEPVAAVVLSTSTRSGDYTQFAGPLGEVRPGHTDLVKYYQSKGYVDIRGGGRSSYRSTVSDVIGGAIARRYLAEHFGTRFLSAVCQVGHLKTDKLLSSHVEKLALQAGGGRQVPLDEIKALEDILSQSAIQTLDPDFDAQAGNLIEQLRDAGDSVGSMVEVVAVNVPPLIGAPLYQSLKLRIMGVLGGVNAAQSCELGAGLQVVERKGSTNNDPIRHTGFRGNNHGGLLGGISTGMPIVARVGFKPTSSIQIPQQSVRKNLEDIDFQMRRGRHDPCVGMRAGITLESRLAIELMNAVLMRQAGCLDIQNFTLF
jgi:chorismate synthase